MNILYYTWNEIIRDDVTSQLIALGHSVDVITYSMNSYTKDAAFIAYIEDCLSKRSYDCIFTADYFPVISKVSLRKKIPYIAWLYDSPCISVYTEMIFNPYNYIFHFDRAEVAKFREKGVKNIWYMPLAVNTDRINHLLETTINPDLKFVGNQVALLGNLYDQDCDYDKIQGLTAYAKGYVNGIIYAQLQIMGYDLIEESIPESLMEELLSHVTFNLEDEFFITNREMLMYMIKKKATAIERKQLLQMISSHFKTTLYSASDASDLVNVENRGYLNYQNEMPIMFHQAKINLNITLRTIQSGISLRALDIMGAGGFLLSNYQPELAACFKENEEMVMYYNQNDLIQKINYYLNNEEERAQIAENGKRRIETDYSYKIQLQRIMNTVFSL
jgi:spore maturation protein CgeB